MSIFFEGTWSEALQEAKATDKLVFVDVDTDWCPPCKQMDNEVLPLPEVGQQYNAVFVNYKLDAATKHKLAPQLFSILRNAAGRATVDHDLLTAKQSYPFAETLLPYLDLRHQRAYRESYMLYCIQLRDTARVKQLGLEMTDGLMAIPMDSVKAEDDRRYRAIMEPFWSGAQDSTKVEGFAEEQQYIRNSYSRELPTLSGGFGQDPTAVAGIASPGFMHAIA